MEGIDWIKLQEEEFGNGLMMKMMPVSNVDILSGLGRDPAIGVGSGQVQPGFFSQWGEPTGIGLIPASGGGASAAEDGLDSLDCLLSVSNSQTDAASLEDDGISIIFSDCKSLWNNFNVVVDTFPPALSEPGSDQLPPPRDKYHDHRNNELKRKGSSDSQQRMANCPDVAPGFHFASENQARLKRPKPDRHPIMSSANISFQQVSSSASSGDEPDAEAIAQMKEIIYHTAAFRPVHFGAETVDKPKRKNVRISSDPQTVAARQRRERISERIRVLQKLVPGGSKMDTASMLDEAANYLKFLRSQVKALEALTPKIDQTVTAFPANTTTLPFSPFVNYTFALQQPHQFSIQSQNPVNKSVS